MKYISLIAIIGALAGTSAFADDYAVFRVCQDQHVIRTSDGADAGHVAYVVYDPGSEQIVSTVITGGVCGDRYVPVPVSVMRFGTDREVTMTSITRERLVAAPVVESTTFTSSAVIDPGVIDRTYTHFGVDRSSTGLAREGRANADVNDQARDVPRAAVRRDEAAPTAGDRESAAGSATNRQADRRMRESAGGSSGDETNAAAARENGGRDETAADTGTGRKHHNAAQKETPSSETAAARGENAEDRTAEKTAAQTASAHHSKKHATPENESRTSAESAAGASAGGETGRTHETIGDKSSSTTESERATAGHHHHAGTDESDSHASETPSSR